MQRDTRLARLLHVLIHMHLRGGATTSQTIALMLHTLSLIHIYSSRPSKLMASPSLIFSTNDLTESTFIKDGAQPIVASVTA